MNSPTKKPEKILVVDDNTYELKLQEEFLTEEGYEVTTAANGREALDRLEHEKVSLVVSDILMPEMDGFTFCREVKQRKDMASIPFIFYTASYVDEKDKELGESLGVDLFLIKPLPMDDYLKAVRDVLMKRRPFKEAEEPLEEKEYLQKYSERVVNKLEEKLLELEKAYAVIQKEKENLLAVNLKLLESDRSKTAFFSRIGHELRTPLTGIMGYTDILLADAKGEAKNFLEEISRYGHALDKLLGGIMEYMDYDEGKTAFFPEAFNPEELLNQLYQEMLPLATGKGLALSRKISSPLPLIKADRPSFLKVLNNLFQNAVKFTQAGEITLSASAVPGYVAVSVKDTGIGIREEDQRKIFAGFEQAEDYLTRTQGGIGLGLALAQKLIELNNGKISLESEYGKGSTFTVFFPLVETE